MKQVLILFTRVPQPGKTKTRLQQELTPAQCAEAHTAFLKDEAESCRDPAWDLRIFYGGEGPASELRQILGDRELLTPQQGETLGEKMDRAMAAVLEQGADRCVLVGADLPELERERIRQAFVLLDQTDLVLGPTADGGYYLIGCRQRCPEVFSGQKYGGSTVFADTVLAAEAAGRTVSVLPPLDDVDEPADLRALAARLRREPPDRCVHTRAFLGTIGLEKGGTT